MNKALKLPPSLRMAPTPGLWGLQASPKILPKDYFQQDKLLLAFDNSKSSIAMAHDHP